MDAMTQLLEVMKRLRDPDTGCPWDQRQTYGSIVPYTRRRITDAIGAALKSSNRHDPEMAGAMAANSRRRSDPENARCRCHRNRTRIDSPEPSIRTQAASMPSALVPAINPSTLARLRVGPRMRREVRLFFLRDLIRLLILSSARKHKP